MIRHLLSAVAVAGTVTLAAPLLLAHHSETAEYDNTKPVKFTGTLKKVEWANPHVWVFIEVTEADGKVATWGFSTQPPGALMRRGITKDLLKLGAPVSVEGNRARDGSNNASMRRLAYADGTNVFAPPGGAQ
jgi:hypothetical protein